MKLFLSGNIVYLVISKRIVFDTSHMMKGKGFGYGSGLQ